MKRRIVSFVAALSVAVSSLICGAVTAGAETTKFDIVKEIKNVTIAEDAKHDTAMCGYYGLTSGGYTVFVSGLDTEKAAKIEELLAKVREERESNEKESGNSEN